MKECDILAGQTYTEHTYFHLTWRMRIANLILPLKWPIYIDVIIHYSATDQAIEA